MLYINIFNGKYVEFNAEMMQQLFINFLLKHLQLLMDESKNNVCTLHNSTTRQALNRT